MKTHVSKDLLPLTLLCLACLALPGHAQDSLLNGLVGYWAFDEGQGVTLADGSGYENHGFLHPGVSWAEGRIGTALQFDGGNDAFVQVPSSDSLNISDALTVCAWIKSDNTEGGYVVVSKWNDFTGEWSYHLKDHNNTDMPQFILSKAVHADLVDLSGASHIIIGQWMHLAATFDAASGVTRLYVNGQLDSQGASTGGLIQPSLSDVLIGAVNLQGDGSALENFIGLIDEVGLFKRALLPEEIQRLYEVGFGEPAANAAPRLTWQPSSQTVPSGSSVTFKAVAWGSQPLDYQWRCNGVDLQDGARISGATASTLEILTLTPEDAGTYTVLVSNAHGVVTSNPAALTVVLRPPEITTDPVDLTVLAGAPASFAVSALGSLPIGYQWQRNGVALGDGGHITGSQGPILSLAAAGMDDLGVYTVLVRNAYGSKTSAPATLTVILQPPDITADPVDQTVFGGAAVTFSVSATGSLPLGYQWQRNGVDLADSGRITGTGTSTLTIAAAAPEDLGLYSVEVSNDFGWMMSFPAQLTVLLAPPTITRQPPGQTVALGATVSLQVQATGSVPLSYQWQRNGFDLRDAGPFSGVRTDTLTITGVGLADLGDYTAMVENSLARIQSKAATVATFSVVLQIGRDGEHVVVSWNEAGKGMKLQTATQLADPDWEEVTGSESVTTVSLPIVEAGSAYFRLTRQVDLARFVWIPPGTFLMGSSETELGSSPMDGPQTTVTISRGFWIGKLEVTQQEYLAVMGTNPSQFVGDPQLPVESVTWFEASEYCAALTLREAAAGRLPANYVYRLPTEAEWEYACRAGTSTRRSYGDDLGDTQLADYGWYEANSGGTTHSVGLKRANPWGLYDMHGNVWEWCQDWLSASLPGGTVTNPKGPGSGSVRAVRGASWFTPGFGCRSGVRNGAPPEYRAVADVGFRVTLGPSQP